MSCGISIDQFKRAIVMRKWRDKDIPILDVPPRLLVVVGMMR